MNKQEAWEVYYCSHWGVDNSNDNETLETACKSCYDAALNRTCKWSYENMIWITQCGFKNRIKDKYCPHCGGRIKT